MTVRTNPSPARLLITSELLHRAKQGDHEALETLLTRYHPRLVRWASGRLPPYARSLFDTSDLVQETLIRAVEGIDRIEVRGPGLFQSYVRQAILNGIRDQIRRARKRPDFEDPLEQLESPAPSPLERAIGADVLERYERCLRRLTEDERHLIHLRIELDFTFEEIATITQRNSADSARMATQRAIRKLGEILGRDA